MFMSKLDALHCDLDFWHDEIDYWNTFCDGYPMQSRIEECEKNIKEIKAEIALYEQQ